MSHSWSRVPLSNLATIVGRGIAPKYADDGDFVVLNQKCVRGGRVSMGQARRHDSSQRAVRTDKRIVPGDILVNSTGVGTLGRTAPAPSSQVPLTADSHLTIIRPKEEVDARWLAYALAFSEPEIEAMAEGSTGQTELSRHRLALLEVELPPPAHQTAIAATLGVLDDKIESDQRARTLLRRLGRSKLHRSLSSGTRAKTLEELTLSIARGVGPKYADGDPSAPVVINQKCIRDGWVSLEPARRMFDRKLAPAKRAASGDILVNSTGTGTLGRVARWHEGDIYVDSHVSVVKPDANEVEPVVLAYALLDLQGDIEELATGSTGQTELGPTRLGSLPVSLPAVTPAVLASELLEIEDRADQLASEIARLTALRDALLPELLSGRIRVPVEEMAV